jgi:O-antigen/teichoic acid export membrane protein
MKDFFIRIFSHKFSQDALINISGTIINSLLGLFFFILILRVLGPTEFGIFAILAAILVLLSDVFDLGTNQGLVKFISESLAKKDQRSVSQFLKLGFEIKILVGLLLIVLGWPISYFVARFFFPFQNFWLIFLAFLGILPTLLLGFVFYSLQGLGRFVKANLCQIFANTLRLILIFVFLFFDHLDVFTSVLVFSIAPFFGFLAGIYFLPKEFLQVRGEFLQIRSFLRFNFWLALYFVFFSIYSRIDTFLLAGLVGAYQTGIYNAAARLLSPFMQVSGNFSTALAPSFAKLKNLQLAKNLFRQTLKFAVVLVLPMFLIIFLAPFLIPVLFGKSYLDSIPSLQILTVGMMFLFISVPATTFIVYFFEKPQVYVILTFFQIFLILVFGFVLIPRFGATGAAISFLISQIWLFSSSFIFVLAKRGW